MSRLTCEIINVFAPPRTQSHGPGHTSANFFFLGSSLATLATRRPSPSRPMNVRESMEELESGNGRWQATEMNETIPKGLTEEMNNYARDWLINYVVTFVSLTAEIAIHSWDMDICVRGTNIMLSISPRLRAQNLSLVASMSPGPAGIRRRYTSIRPTHGPGVRRELDQRSVGK